jgi:hypothetical protein
VGTVDNGGAFIVPFYRVIERRKAGGQGEGGSGNRTSMVPVVRNENGEGA